MNTNVIEKAIAEIEKIIDSLSESQLQSAFNAQGLLIVAQKELNSSDKESRKLRCA